MESPTPGLSVIVPCHNEQGALADELARLERALAGLTMEHEIIVVDDGSTDASAEAVDTGRYRLVRHPLNLGYGAAIKSGVRAARFDTIAITDADGTYPAERLPELVAALVGAEMVVGARTGAKVHIPLLRRPAKWVLAQLAQFLTRRRIPDLNSGLRVFRREVFERFEHLFPDGFSLTTTITLATLTSRLRVEFIPIDYHARVGKSKIRPIGDTIEFFKLILRTVLYFDPLRVFVPLSLALIVVSLLVGVISIALGDFLDVTTSLLFVTGLQFLAIGALADLITRRTK